MIFSFGLKIIFLLLVIGGATAIIGNYIGRAIGRRHLMIFNLRPRHTANAITVLTGILIVCFTVAIMLTVSQDARTALFGLEKLRQDADEKNRLLSDLSLDLERMTAEKEEREKNLAELKTNLDRAKREIAALAQTKAKLNREVKISRQGEMLFKVNDTLLTSLIKAGPERTKLETGLKEILSAADAAVRSFGVNKPEHLIFMSPEDFEHSLEWLQQKSGEYVISVKVARNTLSGEEVSIRFNLAENRLIYSPGEMIAETSVNSTLSRPEIEQEIKKLLATTHLAAKATGVIPDASGSVGKVTYEQLFSLSKKIKTYNKEIRLQSLAKTAVYAIGPLEIDFKILYR